MDQPERSALAKLLRGRRWAALATQTPDGPHAGWVAYALEPDFQGLLLHISRLAPHTRHLLADPRAALGISEAERDGEDPQTLARVAIVGEAGVVASTAAGYEAAMRCYLERFPAAEPRFAFADFELFRFVPKSARFVGGFGRAHSVGPEELRAIAAERE